jgi:xanthine dehydrogenase accessory factor
MGGMKDMVQMVREWDAAGLACAEAILVGTQHSSPRQPGARLVVNEKGEVGGAVSMGCVESDLREHLLALLRGEGTARIIHYGSSFGPVLEVGLTCGGEIDVWIRRHDPESPAWKGVCGLAPDARAVLLTQLDADSGQILLRPGDPPPAADLAGTLEELWARGGTRRVAVQAAAYFAELIAPEPRLLIVGASPIASALCDLASRTGFRAWIVDPRRDFARPELFPSAQAVVHRWPEEGLAEAGLDAHSYVAVLAHDAKLDVPALSAALRASARYIGLLGSAGTQADRRGQLEAAGFAPADVARIRGPIGLKSIGALEPVEIAVSILAELIMARRGKLEPGGKDMR